MYWSLVVCCAALAALYLYSIRTFDYWRKRGVKHDKPVPLFGNIASVMLVKKSYPQMLEQMYKKHPKEKIVGFYKCSEPVLLIRDPEIIKRILTTDFNYFYARCFNATEVDYRNIEILRRNLVFVEGDMWRLLRQGTTPAFSSGKLKAMFPLVVARAERLRERARAASAGAGPVDALDLVARYTIEIIGACGLGVDAETLQDDNSAFHQLNKDIFKMGLPEKAALMLKTLFPFAFKNLKHLGRVESRFCNMINDIVVQRNNEPSGRRDFIDLMLEIRAQGPMECESLERRAGGGAPVRVSAELDDQLLAAQIFILYVAGYETSSTATAHTLHQLAHCPRAQRLAQAAVDGALARHGGAITYDAIREMQYLEWALNEGMRMWPPIGYLFRTCRQEYSFEDMGVTIEANTTVMVSVMALNHDPRYWTRPDQFRPERFGPEEGEPKHKFAYLPFGAGPRACIGERMGVMTSLAGLAAILSRFDVSPAPGAPREPRVYPGSRVVTLTDGPLNLVFTPRLQTSQGPTE